MLPINRSQKHLRWAHVPVISTLRYPSSLLPRPNQERMCCGGRGAETCILDLRAAFPAAVAESTPPSDVPWHGNESAVANRSPAPQRHKPRESKPSLRVESRNGAVRGRLAVARFRSPLIKPDVRISRIRLSDWISSLSSRTRCHPDSTQWNNAQPAVDRIPREAGISATRPHLMTPPEVMPYGFVDIIVDRLICLCRRAVAEICAPTSQNQIQLIPHLGPRLNVIRYQKISHFLLDTRHALLGRTCT